MGSAGPLAINESIFGKMPFDPIRDLAPVTLAASTPNVLVVHPALRAATLKELIALAKARPGEINFASSGHGTPAHLAGEVQLDGGSQDGSRAVQGGGSGARRPARR